MLLNYDSPLIEKKEVYLEHVIAGSPTGQSFETPGGHETMDEGNDYSGGWN